MYDAFFGWGAGATRIENMPVCIFLDKAGSAKLGPGPTGLRTLVRIPYKNKKIIQIHV